MFGWFKKREKNQPQKNRCVISFEVDADSVTTMFEMGATDDPTPICNMVGEALYRLSNGQLNNDIVEAIKVASTDANRIDIANHILNYWQKRILKQEVQNSQNQPFVRPIQVVQR